MKKREIKQILQTENEFKILWPFYLEAFLVSLFYIMAPFMVLYFSSIGLSLTKIGILIAIFPLATLIFEIPTGAIADLYGRKFSVVIGYIANGIILLLLFFFKNYYALLILFALSGIAYTLTSGSYHAWVVDLLNYKKRKELVKSFFAGYQSLLNLGLVISGLVGAFFVAKFSLGSMWLVSGFGFLLGGVLLYFGQEIYEKKELRIKSSFKNLKTQTKKSISYSYKHPVLFYLFIIIFIFGIAASFEGLISWTPLLKSFNFPDYAFGYLWSAMGFIGVIAPLLSKKFVKTNKEKKFLTWMAILTLLYGFAVLVSNSLSLLILIVLAGSFLSDFESPIEEVYFHRFVPSKKRATISSARSMFFSLATIIAFPVAGFLVDKIGGRYTIFISGLLMIPIIILYLRIKEKKTGEV